MTKKYFYRVWCDDCVTVGDTQGCFDGTKENDEERFETPEQAYLAGCRGTHACSLWEFEVVNEETGEIVELDEKTESDLFLESCKPSF